MKKEKEKPVALAQPTRKLIPDNTKLFTIERTIRKERKILMRGP